MEDYKKKYEEALERARKINNGDGVAAPPDWTVCETIFPELKESEDERIRKEIINYFKCQSKDEPTRKTILNKWINWLKCIKVFPKEKVQSQSKQDWSEEEKARIDRIINVLDWAEEKGRISYSDWEDYVTYVKSLKPQNKQNTAWSEEDEKLLNLSLENLTELKNRFGEKYGKVSDCIDWLKSLKERYTWKPSDEQIKLLREVQQALLGKDCHNRFVDFMYELKRLREE